MNDRELSVIAVDDDEAILGILKRAFGGARSFVTFASPPDFLARAELEHCDMVFMDINMPGGQDGLSLTRHIKRVAPQCDVVVITGAATLANAMAAIKAGAYDFLTKPFSSEVLEAAVERCVEKRAVSSELRLIREAQAELTAAHAQLKSAERMKEAFLSVIGHELRTPLSKVLGGLELLKGAPEAQRDALTGAAMTGAGELREVIGSLILYAESSKEPAPENCAELNLDELAAAVSEELAPRAAVAGVTLTLRRSGGRPVVRGNTDWLRSAFRQLTLNAILFNKKGGIAEIAVEDQPAAATVTVSDSGMGIPQELLSGLGTPFYQVADYLTRRTGGLGLGLAIVKRVAEAHKGGVTVRSEPGKGTVFTVTLKKNGASAVNVIVHDR